MKFIIVSLVLAGLVLLVKGQEFSEDWENWKKQNNKVYPSGRSTLDDSQEKVRFGIFQENLQKIKEHNAKQQSFKLGVNEYSDLTEDELRQRFTAKIDQVQIRKNNKLVNVSSIKSVKAVVDSINWVTNGFVAPVQNQESCGSCYAFSTAAALESAYAIKYNLKNAVKSFSAQQLLDCSYYKYIINGVIGNLGCRGGYDYLTLYYAYQYGIQQASSYNAYSGSVRSCSYSSSKVVTRVTGIYTASLAIGDYAAMKNIVLKQPLMVYMYVTSDLYSYVSGIYTGPNCSSSKKSCPLGINHAVTIVGFGSDAGVPYWIVKNSWGPSWGENGYFRIAMGQNTCCIEGYSYYPSVI